MAQDAGEPAAQPWRVIIRGHALDAAPFLPYASAADGSATPPGPPPRSLCKRCGETRLTRRGPLRVPASERPRADIAGRPSGGGWAEGPAWPSPNGLALPLNKGFRKALNVPRGAPSVAARRRLGVPAGLRPDFDPTAGEAWRRTQRLGRRGPGAHAARRARVGCDGPAGAAPRAAPSARKGRSVPGSGSPAASAAPLGTGRTAARPTLEPPRRARAGAPDRNASLRP